MHSMSMSHKAVERTSSHDSGVVGSLYDSHHSSSLDSTELDFNGNDGEGYDCEFEPALDGRYECPICLLVLRNPVQTECGHRFCRACITKWLRNSREPQCPIDKMPISEVQLYPDNFAKREINMLTVRCANAARGCKAVIPLKTLATHKKECEYELEPCPNRCSGIFHRKSMKRHIQESCPKRLVRCQHCSVEVQAGLMKEHMDLCPRVGVQCDHCGQKMLRQELDEHTNSSCLKVPVRCIFSPLGCDYTGPKTSLNTHMEESIQKHMKMLANSVAKLLRMVHSPNITSHQIGKMLQDHIGIGEHDLPSGPGIAIDPIDPYPSENITSGYLSTATQEGLVSTANSTVSRNIGNVITSSVPSAISTANNYTSVPQSAAAQLLQNLGHLPSDLETLRLEDPREDSSLKTLRNKVSQQETLVSRLSLELSEYKSKTRSLKEILESQNKYIRRLESNLQELTTRSYNGVYVWKIDNYTTKRKDAMLGRNTVLHSPAFYSSCHGYKLCIRVNLNGVDSASGTHISLFIHFLRGDYDDILDWPFSGHISMAILDQNEDCHARRPISESFEANPSFAAFQRPASSRNHKGFGYMEFVPVDIIEKGTYIRNDTLVIRVKIQEH